MEEKKWMCDQCNRLYESTELKWDIVIEEGTPVVKAGYCSNCGSVVKPFLRNDRLADSSEDSEDLEGLLRYFLSYQKSKIQNHEFINSRFFDKLTTYGTSDLKKEVINYGLLGDSIKGMQWVGEAYCLKCREKIPFALSKTNLVKYIEHLLDSEYVADHGTNANFLCSECRADVQNKTKEEGRIQRTPERFIKNFLIPRKNYPGYIEFHRETMIRIGEWLEEFNEEELNGIHKYIREMPYGEFLQTFYWRAIALFVKERKKKCEICGSMEQLEVHHKDYGIRGMEWERVDRLQCLCHNCHSSIHGV